MFNLFNLFSRKIVSVDLASNVRLTVTPKVGGVMATLIEDTGMFLRQERCYFSTIDELITSLRLTDEKIVKKLSKAF